MTVVRTPSRAADHAMPRLADERRHWRPPMVNVLAVAVGGAIGVSLRYSLLVAFPVEAGRFPWATFAANVAGAFGLGLLVPLLLKHWDRSRWTRHLHPLLCIGVLGSFTTFSSLTLEAIELARAGGFVLAPVYGVGSAVSGLVAALLGVVIGRAGLRTRSRKAAP